MSIIVFSKKDIVKRLDNIKKKIRLHHSKAKQNLDVVWKTDDSDEIGKEHAYIYNLAIQIGFIEELKKDVKKWKVED